MLPLYDAELTRPVAKRLAALGVDALTGARAKGLAARRRRAAGRERRMEASCSSPPTGFSSPSAAGR